MSAPVLTPSAEALWVTLNSITGYGVFATDADRRITMWNEGATRMFRYSNDEIVGQSVDVLFTPDERAYAEQALHTAAHTGRAVDDRYLVRQDGSRFFASGMIFPIYGGAGDAQGYVAVYRDATERNAWEHGLLDTQHALDADLAERNRQLSEELAERRAAEERTRHALARMVTTQEEERRRIARDLHDHLGQQVTALHLQIQTLVNELKSAGSPSLERATTVQELFAELDDDLDFLTWELRPAALYTLGLVPALMDYTTAFSRNYDLPVTFDCPGMDDVRLAHDIEINLYRIAQEALNNTFKHAKAHHADVLLQLADGRVVLTISDDGVGFQPDTPAAQVQDRGMGLDGMRERAALIGGSLHIEAEPNQGTTVIASVPAVFRQVS